MLHPVPIHLGQQQGWFHKRWNRPLPHLVENPARRLPFCGTEAVESPQGQQVTSSFAEGMINLHLMK